MLITLKVLKIADEIQKYLEPTLNPTKKDKAGTENLKFKEKFRQKRKKPRNRLFRPNLRQASKLGRVFQDKLLDYQLQFVRRERNYTNVILVFKLFVYALQANPI
jgi:hypothetical protein